MAPRPNWKGFLKLSLVSCSVALYTATSTSQRVSFNIINRKTGNRVRYQVVDGLSVDDARCENHDEQLWTFRPDSFLPHRRDTDPFPQLQPILLTAGPSNANNSTVRFVIDGAVPPNLEGYERVVFMFDGHDDAQVESARGHWKRLKGEGHTLSYWQQNRDGRWERKA